MSDQSSLREFLTSNTRLLSLNFIMLSFINTNLLSTYLQDKKHWLTSHSVVTKPSEVHSLVLGVSDAEWKPLGAGPC